MQLKKLLITILILFATPCFAEEWNCNFNPKYIWPLSDKELENWNGEKDFKNVRLNRNEKGLHDVLLVDHGSKELKKTFFYDVFGAQMMIGNASYEGFYDSHRRMFFFTSSFNFSVKILVAKTGEAVLSEDFGVWEGKCSKI